MRFALAIGYRLLVFRLASFAQRGDRVNADGA
jgi:hypothetical protein